MIELPQEWIEDVARAVYEAQRPHLAYSWNDEPVERQRGYLRMARAALETFLRKDNFAKDYAHAAVGPALSFNRALDAVIAALGLPESPLACETCKGTGVRYEDRDYATETLSCEDCEGTGKRPLHVTRTIPMLCLDCATPMERTGSCFTCPKCEAST